MDQTYKERNTTNLRQNIQECFTGPLSKRWSAVLNSRPFKTTLTRSGRFVLTQFSHTIMKTASLEIAFAKYQVHIRIRNKDRPDISATLANVERDDRIKRDFRLVLDTGCAYTVVPQLLRARLPSRAGWGTDIT